MGSFILLFVSAIVAPVGPAEIADVVGGVSSIVWSGRLPLALAPEAVFIVVVDGRPGDSSEGSPDGPSCDEGGESSAVDIPGR